MNKCSSCHGTGKILTDCPYCRCSDDFYYSQLRPGNCMACGGDGYLDEICPVCNGTGQAQAILKLISKASNY